jgi:hypothetical protein
MHFSWRRWRLAFIAVLTAITVSTAFAGVANAAEPGEWGDWAEEHVGGHMLEARDAMTEARNGQGDLLQVWRGETNDRVWMSLNAGNAFELRNPDGTSTETYYRPTVVPFGSNSWMVFHTGTDGRIYYAQLNPDYSWSGSWTAIGWGQSTSTAVSATQVGANSTALYVMYRGSTDDRIWGTYYNGSYWSPSRWISTGFSPSAPSVTFNSHSGLWAAVRGTDNQVWINHSYTGTGDSWVGWTQQGGNTYVSPTIAATGTGQMLVSEVDESSYRPNYRTYGALGNPLGDWSQDITGWQTIYSLGLSVIGASVWAILTGLNGDVYYKQAYSPY